jgi:hypothetical protein
LSIPLKFHNLGKLNNGILGTIYVQEYEADPHHKTHSQGDVPTLISTTVEKIEAASYV